MTTRRAEVLLLLITILWGGTFALVKEAMPNISPAMFVLLRFTIALGVASVLWPKSYLGWNLRLVGRGVVLGILFGAGFLLQTIGLETTSAATSAFITGTMVVFVPFVVRIMGIGHIKPSHWLAVTLVLVGLYVFLAPELYGISLGDWLTLLSAVIWAFYVAMIDRWSHEYRSSEQSQNTLVLFQFLVTVLLSLCILPFDARTDVSFTREVIFALLYCGIAASVVTTMIQTRYQRFTHPIRAAIIYAAEPIVAAIVAFVLLNEDWTTRNFLGAGILLLGIIGPEVWQQRQKEVY